MFRYKIGYVSYDGSRYFELEHHRKYSEEQVIDLIADAVIEAYEEHKKNRIHVPAQLDGILNEIYFKKALLRRGFTETPYHQEVIMDLDCGVLLSDKKKDWEVTDKKTQKVLDKIYEYVRNRG